MNGDNTPVQDERDTISNGGGRVPDIQVADAWLWLRRHGLVILVCAILGAAGTSIYISRIRPAVFRASAILAIVPPQYSSELLPSTLTVQGYQELLEADAVLAETEARLVEKGELPEGARLSRNQVKSRIFVSQRREETSLAPMIRLEASSQSPDRAAAIVNTWAEVFLNRAHDLMFGTVLGTIRFLEEEYPKAGERLTAQENERLELANRLDRHRADAVSRWLHTIAEARADGTRMVNSYGAETDRLLSAYRAEHGLKTRKEELDSLQTVLKEHQVERSQVEGHLAAKERELQETKKHLAQTEPVLLLTRSLPEEVVLGGIDEGSGKGVFEALKDLRLVHETRNPVFSQLEIEVADRETEAAVMRPRAEELSKLIDRESTQIHEFEIDLANDEARLSEIRSERESGMSALYEARSALVSSLEVARDTELASIDRELEERLAQLDRQIGQERALFEDLADKYNQAVLAKGQDSMHAIRLATPAVSPRSPLPRAGSSGVALGILLGVVLGLVISLARDAVTRSGS